ncbi:MAG: hypothetical protein DRI32_07665 [Chloroflexi bacterium]|nr:MAG: hypothetical protein DRI32_07665 [Chloroflexota bacterium]
MALDDLIQPREKTFFCENHILFCTRILQIARHSFEYASRRKTFLFFLRSTKTYFRVLRVQKTCTL